MSNLRIDEADRPLYLGYTKPFLELYLHDAGDFWATTATVAAVTDRLADWNVGDFDIHHSVAETGTNQALVIAFEFRADYGADSEDIINAARLAELQEATKVKCKAAGRAFATRFCYRGQLLNTEICIKLATEQPSLDRQALRREDFSVIERDRKLTFLLPQPLGREANEPDICATVAAELCGVYLQFPVTVDTLNLTAIAGQAPASCTR